MCLDFVGDIFGGGGGGGGAGQPQSSTVVQGSIPDWLEEPWKGQIIPEGERLYGEGPREYFPGSTFAPYSRQTLDALSQMEGLAGNPAMPDNVSGALQGLFDRGGQIEGFDQISGPIRDIAMGNAGIDTSRMEDIAGGGLLGANPYIDDLVGQVASDATTQANRGAWFQGREGSPYAAGEVARQVAEATAPIRMADYGRERGYMQDAIGDLAGLQGTNLANRMRAGGTLLQSGQAAQNDLFRSMGAAPGAYHFQAAPADYLARVGTALEAKERQNIADQIARHDFEQNADWDNLGRFAGLISGAPLVSGSTTTTYSPDTGFSAGGLLGGALAGSQIGQMIGAPYTPYGALAGGLLGGFA